MIDNYTAKERERKTSKGHCWGNVSALRLQSSQFQLAAHGRIYESQPNPT
jgi:hypothetical protein